jgi:DNA repair exonuclease SbcCD ATPase subunit
VVNEMHSIFGTEISALPVSLENYYKRYFNNRQAVTDLSDQYEAVFSQNKQQLDSLKGKIGQLKTELNGDKSVIENEQDALLAESRRMQSLLSSGRTAEYNSAVGPYNARVAHLRSLISAYNSKIKQVNSLVEQYNSLAYMQEDLYKSIDTRVQSQSVQ